MAIYLDHAATTPLDPDVLDAMRPYFDVYYGNASSQHAAGRQAEMAVDRARETIAAILGANPKEIYFTSGGTESDNWAVKGTVYANRAKGRHVVSTTIEHHAVLNALKQLEREGYEVSYVGVDKRGLVDESAFVAALRADTVLAICMYANNEVGTVQPVARLAAICRQRGVLFLTDAVQAAGALSLNVRALDVDMLSLSAHKFYAPKGVGLLYVKSGVHIEPLLAGGAQERGLRGGTYNVPAIVGMAAGLEKAIAHSAGDCAHVAALRDDFVRLVTQRIEGVSLNGDADCRLPSNANLCFAGVRGESILVGLDLKDIYVGMGSACTAGTTEPSHVLLAMGLSETEAKESVRFTFGKENTAEDVARTVAELELIISRLRR